MKRGFSRYRQLLAYLLVLAAAVMANVLTIKNANHDSAARLREQRAGCERTNDLRKQLNSQSVAVVESERITFKLFLKVARQIPDEGSAFRADLLEAAQAQQKLADSYEPLEIVNCDKAYPSSDS